MARKVSKNELLRRIKELDELEIVIEDISRSESSFKKQNQLSCFTREAKRQIDNSRDVILMTVALK